MSEISEDHVEWAVVHRFKLMAEQPHESFNVTQAFSLLTSTLCWTLQRVRNNGTSPEDRIAASLLSKLSKQTVEDIPWHIHTGASDISRLDLQSLKLGPFANFANLKASDFLIQLRNTVAHGDLRNVRPFHGLKDRGRELAGFTFGCQVGTLTLLEIDMRRITVGLAEIFCNALRRSEKHSGDSSFGRDASQYVAERAA